MSFLKNLNPGKIGQRKKRENIISNSRNENRELAIDPTDIKKLIRGYYEEISVNNFNNFMKMDKFFQ